MSLVGWREVVEKRYPRYRGFYLPRLSECGFGGQIRDWREHVVHKGTMDLQEVWNVFVREEPDEPP